MLIAKITPDGPAARAGLRGPQIVKKRRGPLSWDTIDFAAADLITAIDGETIKNADDFLTAIESKRPGDRVDLTIVRGGQEFKVPVTLGSGERAHVAGTPGPANVRPGHSSLKIDTQASGSRRAYSTAGSLAKSHSASRAYWPL